MLITMWIGIIQDAFQTTKGINMEETPHITLLKRISNKTQSAQSRNDKVDEVVKDELPNDYDYLGELEIKEVIVSRVIQDITTKEQKHMNLAVIINL